MAVPNINYSVVVAMNNKYFAPPSMAPRHSGYYNGIQFFPFDVMVNMLVMPRECQLISLPKGPVADCA